MAHFAELNEKNEVLQIVVVSNEVTIINGIEDEQRGIDLLTSLMGGRWKQCSINANFRGVYPAIGAIYDEENDQFLNPFIDNSK